MYSSSIMSRGSLLHVEMSSGMKDMETLDDLITEHHIKREKLWDGVTDGLTVQSLSQVLGLLLFYVENMTWPV